MVPTPQPAGGSAPERADLWAQLQTLAGGGKGGANLARLLEERVLSRVWEQERGSEGARREQGGERHQGAGDRQAASSPPTPRPPPSKVQEVGGVGVGWILVLSHSWCQEFGGRIGSAARPLFLGVPSVILARPAEVTDQEEPGGGGPRPAVPKMLLQPQEEQRVQAVRRRTRPARAGWLCGLCCGFYKS